MDPTHSQLEKTGMAGILAVAPSQGSGTHKKLAARRKDVRFGYNMRFFKDLQKKLRQLGWGWAGLGGLGWGWTGAGRGRAGLGWAGLGWAGLGWAGLGWAGLGWAGLGCWWLGRHEGGTSNLSYALPGLAKEGL